MAVLPIGMSAEEAAGGFQIERSLRFNSADSAYLNKTFGTPTSQTTWTWSGWIKPGAVPFTGILLGHSGAGSGATNTFCLIAAGWYNAGSIGLRQVTSVGGLAGEKVSSAVLRDPSAWYHIVAVWDTTNATADDRIRLYVNGVRVTSFAGSTNPSSSLASYMNTSGWTHYQGAGNLGGVGGFFDGEMTETYFIDGQALDPTSFGEFNSTTGVWQPIQYTGTYGNNGFYTNFSDNSGTTSTTLGKDYSGNSNNWTPNNFSVTAGSGNDSLVDTPTPYGTDTGAGGEVRGNYATLNPLKNGAGATLTNGNLDITQASTFSYGVGTIGVTSGKWYWEMTPTAAPSGYFYSIGIQPEYTTIDSAYRYSSNGLKYPLSGAGSAYGNTYTSGDVIGVAYDGDNGNLYFYKNGTIQNSGTAAFTGLNDGTVWMPWVYMDTYPATSGCSAVLNFGQRPFAYAAPSGYKSLCTTNLPNPAIADGSTAMNVVTYTGNDSQSITGVGFQPDLVWVKSRSSGAYNHQLHDSVRGATAGMLASNSTAAEDSLYQFDSFDADGFTTDSGNITGVNNSGQTFVAWNWKAGGTGVSNTDGSITSTVSANPTAGFSIVTFTSQASGTGTFGHGLGIAPSLILLKTTGVTGGWNVYHKSLGATKYLLLQTTGGEATSTTRWNDTEPTSSVVTLGTNAAGSYAHVAYCFAPVESYSSFGNYQGNGSADGSFIYTGFRPRFVLVKRTDTSGQPWQINDAARNPSNLANLALHPNASDAEATYSSAVMDILSNGFKLRGSDAYTNASGGTYIYAAFAENPFKYSLAR